MFALAEAAVGILIMSVIFTKLKKRFYPKILFPTVKLIFTGFIAFLFFKSLTVLLKKTDTADAAFLFSAMAFILFSGYFTFHLAYFFCFYFKYITIEEGTLSIFELKNLKNKKIRFDEIVGYSKSEVYFGRYAWKPKSIIIYSKAGHATEILSNFVYNMDEIEKELKSHKVKYLGFENYNTGWFFRKYKFLKM